MRILFSPDYTAAAISLVTLTPGASVTVTRGHSVTGYALIGCNLAAGATLTATGYSVTLGAITGDVLIDLTSTPVTSSTWTLTAVNGGTYGVLFPGKLKAIYDPTYPYAVGVNISAVDRQTVGGVGYSVLKKTAWAATMQFASIPASDLTNLSLWYTDTLGLRRAFVVEEAAGVGAALHLVRAPSSNFPWSISAFDSYAATLQMEALQIA